MASKNLMASAGFQAQLASIDQYYLMHTYIHIRTGINDWLQFIGSEPFPTYLAIC